MAKKHSWTEDELAFLREYYPTKATAWIAKKLKRTVYGVRYKASSEKIKKSNNASSDWREKQYQKGTDVSSIQKKRGRPRKDESKTIPEIFLESLSERHEITMILLSMVVTGDYSLANFHVLLHEHYPVALESHAGYGQAILVHDMFMTFVTPPVDVAVDQPKKKKRRKKKTVATKKTVKRKTSPKKVKKTVKKVVKKETAIRTGSAMSLVKDALGGTNQAKRMLREAGSVVALLKQLNDSGVVTTDAQLRNAMTHYNVLVSKVLGKKTGAPKKQAVKKKTAAKSATKVAATDAKSEADSIIDHSKAKNDQTIIDYSNHGRARQFKTVFDKSGGTVAGVQQKVALVIFNNQKPVDAAAALSKDVGLEIQPNTLKKWSDMLGVKWEFGGGLSQDTPETDDSTPSSKPKSGGKKTNKVVEFLQTAEAAKEMLLAAGSVGELAREIGCDQAYLSVVLRQTFELNPRQLLKDYRASLSSDDKGGSGESPSTGSGSGEAITSSDFQTLDGLFKADGGAKAYIENVLVEEGGNVTAAAYRIKSEHSFTKMNISKLNNWIKKLDIQKPSKTDQSSGANGSDGNAITFAGLPKAKRQALIALSDHYDLDDFDLDEVFKAVEKQYKGVPGAATWFHIKEIIDSDSEDEYLAFKKGILAS